MKPFKSALAGAAAAALLISQAAYAAPVARAATPVGDSEGQGGLSAVSAPALAAIGIFIIVGLVMLITDDDDDETPASP